MKLKRIILLLILILLILAGVTAFKANHILKAIIVRTAPIVLQVPVSLEQVTANPASGRLSLEGLTIANPEGFKSEYAMQIGHFDCSITPSSILGTELHVANIQLRGTTIICDGLLADNHRLILANSQNQIPKQPRSESPKPKSSEGRKFVIDHFSFKESQLLVVVEGEVITRVEFPEIELREIGKEGAAVTAAEAALQIYGAIMSETTQVLTINREVIEGLALAKLRPFGISDLEQLKRPEKLLKDPAVVDQLIESILGGKK
jgi:uncharacterized protein involved in outer membrane biogenesis